MATSFIYNANDLILKKKIEKQMNLLKKKAQVQLKDLKLLKLNVIIMVISIVALIVGTLIVNFLFIGDNSVKANSNSYDTSLYDSKSKLYLYSIGAHFGAVIFGAGVFLFIVSLIGFLNDYECAKKKAIDNLIQIEKDKNKRHKTGGANIFQALALGLKMKH